MLEADDGITQGVTFKSFNVVSMLGHGSYGKVYKAHLKADPNQKIMAMKVMNKTAMIKARQLKYAVSEANIMKRTSHPFIVKLNYAF